VEDIVDHLLHGVGRRARYEYQDAGGQYVISIEKLRARVPQPASPGFRPDHNRRILADFTHAIVPDPCGSAHNTQGVL
jgi:hypothetical protein